MASTLSANPGVRHGRPTDATSSLGRLQIQKRRSQRLENETERAAVKPPAQPTLVRTQHLPPPAETPSDLRIRRSSDQPLFRGSVVTVSTCIQVLLTVHGHRTDGCPSLVRAPKATGDAVHGQSDRWPRMRPAGLEAAAGLEPARAVRCSQRGTHQMGNRSRRVSGTQWPGAAAPRSSGCDRRTRAVRPMLTSPNPVVPS